MSATRGLARSSCLSPSRNWFILKCFSLNPQFCISTVNNSRCSSKASLQLYSRRQREDARLPVAGGFSCFHQRRVSDVTRDMKKRATDMDISHAPPQSFAFSCNKEQSISYEWAGLMSSVRAVEWSDALGYWSEDWGFEPQPQGSWPSADRNCPRCSDSNFLTN